MKKRVEIAVVDWLDAAQHPGWSESAEELTVARVRSVGYLVHRDKDCIKLAQSVAEDTSVADVLVVPRKWIRRMGKPGSNRGR